MSSQRKIVVIAEDYERCLPLLEALDQRGAAVEFWNVSKGALSCSEVPPDAIYFCRQSPSSGTRGNQASIALSRSLLWWLHFHGCTVVNGAHAFQLEMSKAAQASFLHAHGINTPATRLVATSAQLCVELAAESRQHPTRPVIIKPDTGGSGSGIKAFASSAEALKHLRDMLHPPYPGALRPQATATDLDVSTDMWVLQEHINEYSEDSLKMRSVLRFEIVDATVQYVVQIRAPVTEFRLCPCDPRMESMLSRVEFRIVSDPSTIPCFRVPGSYRRFCQKLEGVWTALDARVGSAEAFLPTYAADDAGDRAYSAEATLFPEEPVVFEINFNSNYNKTAEALAGVSGANMVADMLCRLARRSKAPAAVLPEL